MPDDDQKTRQRVVDRLTKKQTTVTPLDDAPPVHIEIGSLLASRTKRGAIELKVGDRAVQMDLAKARDVLAMLSGAIEAAVSDELMFKFLTEKIGLPEAAAAMALLDLRELRQGSKDTVYPT
jgi:hypothetical protein